MAGINDYSNTAGSNTTINGIDIAEGCSPAGINNAIRQLMADIADVDDGVVPLQTPDINGGTIDGAAISGSSTIDNSIIGGTTPAAGTFTTLTANTSITGTLNTAAQTNITSVGTLTSATISGDLTVDTNTLYVDSTNNRVGIGTSSPARNVSIVDSGVPYLQLALSTDQAAGNGFELAYDGVAAYLAQRENLPMVFKTNDTERMRIDSSGNVGIGTSTPTSNTLTLTQKYLLLSDSQTKFGDNGKINGVAVDGNSRLEYYTGKYFLITQSGTERMRIDSSGNVGIGTSSPASKLEVEDSVNGDMHLRINNTNTGASARTFLLMQSDGATGGIYLNGANSVGSGTNQADSMTLTSDASASNGLNINATSGSLKFYYNNSETMRIDSSGNVLVGTTSNNKDITGASLRQAGDGYFTRNDTLLYLNRLTSDGELLRFSQAGNLEGNVEVSGATVSYNGFTGTHWSRLIDNSKPTILRGTILESLDEMMDWYQVEFDITDEEGNTTTKKESYALGDGESVGDVITYNFEGTDYQATIIQEDDAKHIKAKISDTADAKNVYGIFMTWDNGDDTVNDMIVAQTGTFVVRMNSAETVSKGDLIQSNGDGTGKVQSDDIIRASTVAKVLSTTKIETYEDGSYIVPCSLHC